MSVQWISLNDFTSKRILEVLSAFTIFFVIFFGEIVCCLMFLIIMIFGGVIGRVAGLIYLVHFYFDFYSPIGGCWGQGISWVRGSRLWANFTSYFPMQLMKTAEISPNKNYIFALFPHGVMSASGFGNFASSTTKFHEKFPGIRSRFATLNFHFYVPFYREWLLSLGMISVKASAIRNLLLQSNEDSNFDEFSSNAVVIAVGGSKEVSHARPGCYQVVLKDRKGFVKIAIQTGAALVPVIAFGENDLYDQPSIKCGKFFARIQNLLKKIIGVNLPIVNGRGFLQYSFGLIPRRCPITTVVGTPIELLSNETPYEDEVNKAHEKFVLELKRLFDDHKKIYLKNPNVELVVV